MASTFQSKDTDKLSRLRNKNLSFVYRKLNFEDSTILKWRDSKKYSKQMGSGSNQALPSNIKQKIDIKLKLNRWDKKGHFILAKGSILQENIKSIYAPNSGEPSFIKKLLMELKAQTDTNLPILMISTPHFLQYTGHLDKKYTEKLKNWMAFYIKWT